MDIRVALSALLVNPLPDTTIEAVFDLFVDKPPLHTSGKRPYLDVDYPDIVRQEAERLVIEHLEAARQAFIVDEMDW